MSLVENISEAGGTLFKAILTNRLEKDVEFLVGACSADEPILFIMAPDKNADGEEVVDSDDVIGEVYEVEITPQEIKLNIDILHHHRHFDDKVLELRTISDVLYLIQTEQVKQTI